MELISKNDGYKIYRNHRAEPYFTFLKNGEKTVEGRIKKGLYKHVKPGDHIVVYNNEETDSVEVLVKATRDYSSIRAMLEGEELRKLLPDVNTLSEGEKVYRAFCPPGKEKEFGIVAIEVQLM
jgi:ASC-1-like (ASCH) protein